MTENKRFTFIHFDWLQWHIYDNESLLCEVTDDEDAENLCKLLNELHDENTHIKNTIKEMYNNERTELGKSTLKQLLEAIQ